MSKEIALKPRVSEKSYAVSEQTNTYTFDVSADVNKHSVASAVAAQFGVSVINVRIASIPGKAKRAYRGRGKYTNAKRSDIRKAYVTLKEGDKLPIFAAVEEELKVEEKK